MSVESILIPGLVLAGDARAPEEEIPAGAGRVPFPAAMEARFRPALAALYHEMHARDDVTALLCFGSAQRGEARPGSDLDLRAVTRGDKRWMESRVVEGVEVQLKMGPLHGWRRMVENQNPSMIHSFATGELLFDKTGEATELKRIAEERFRAGPRVLDGPTREGVRYGLTNMIRDLEDMHEDDVAARMLSGVAVMDSLKYWCIFHRVWEHRKPSMLLGNLRARDPMLAGTFERYYAAPSPGLAIGVVDAVLETMGGRLYHVSLVPETV